MTLTRLLYAALFVTSLVRASAAREVYYQGPLTPANIVPTFDKGYLIVYNLDRSISVYGPDGAPRFTSNGDVTGASFIAIQNAAVDSDGTVVAAVHFQIPLGDHLVRDGGGLAFFDATGRQTRFVDTDIYLPTQVAFGNDHSLWTLGDQKKTGDEHAEFFILHKYSPDGQQVGAFLPRSTFQADIEPNKPFTGGWSLRVADDRIGALLHGMQGLSVWVELSLAGKELGRWPISKDQSVGAFTSAGALYAGVSGNLTRLDRSTGSWRRAPGPLDGQLLAADGNTLVFVKYGSNVLNWVAPRR